MSTSCRSLTVAVECLVKMGGFSVRESGCEGWEEKDVRGGEEGQDTGEGKWLK